MKINRNYFNRKLIYVFWVALFGLVSCNNDDEADVLFTGDSYQNIMQYIEENQDYSSFTKIVYAGKMVDALSAYNSNGGVGYTLFLPTNEAITKFISESDRYTSFEALLADTEYAAEIVRYHLVNGNTPSKDFPNGALESKTISNYFLTITFREENGVISFAVNDVSKVLTTDIVLDNGTIHTIDKMLTPVVFTSFQWIEQGSDFSIFSELLKKCGLEDTLNAFELDELGREIYSEYTLMAESNSLYESKGISSFDDLIHAIDPAATASQDFTSLSNAINKYARYHILEKSVFLDEFATEVYNTYGELPLSVDLDDILKVNTGVMVFDSIIGAGDTVLVNYLQINTEESNIVTRSGAIHQLDQLLFPYLPGRKTVTYQFYEEPVINGLKDIEGNHTISDDDLEFISLIGIKNLTFVKSPTEITGNSNNDYIELSGDVDFSFVTPKILAGRYTLKIVIQRGYSYLANVQTYVDGKKVGVVLDPTTDTRVFRTFPLGTVEFSDFSTHTVKIRTIIPGRVLLDRIIFEPI